MVNASLLVGVSMVVAACGLPGRVSVPVEEEERSWREAVWHRACQPSWRKSEERKLLKDLFRCPKTLGCTVQSPCCWEPVTGVKRVLGAKVAISYK
jgi:hypothetical protein